MNSQAGCKFIEGASLTFWYVSFKTSVLCQNHLKLRTKNTHFHNYLELFEGIPEFLKIKNLLWIGRTKCIKLIFHLY